MTFKDLYYAQEEHFNKVIDSIDSRISVRWFFNAIDKVIPSFIFVNLLLLVVILVLVWFFVIPHMQEVTFIFKSDNIQLVETFNFTISVDGKEYAGLAEQGQSLLEIKKGDKISIDSVDLKDYNISQKIYDFKDQIIINLVKEKSLLPVSFYLFNYDGTNFDKPTNISFACSSGFSGQKTTSSNTFYIDVPDDCGNLSINAQSDGYNLTKGNECDSSACSLEFSPITNVNNGKISIPNGGIKVSVFNDLGDPLSGVKVKIYESNNLQDEIDVSITNQLGLTKIFSGLSVGKYSVYVSYSDNNYLDNCQDTFVNENSVSEVTVKLSKMSLGKIKLVFLDENNLPLKGSLILKNNLGAVLFRTPQFDGEYNLPVYSYGLFYLDFKPDDPILFPLGNYKLDIDSSLTTKTIVVKKASVFNSAKLVIKVIDEDNNPVTNGRVFVQDAVTEFDLLSYVVPETDSNGNAWVLLPEGAYRLRVFNGFSEAFSGTVTVFPSTSGETPQINLTINMMFGYSLLKLQIRDEFGIPSPNTQVFFFKKPKTDAGTKLTNALGLVNHSFKAGTPLYYVVKADNYLPYFSEAKLLMTNMLWDVNLELTPIKLGTPKVEFLGMYDSLGGNEEKAMSIGGTYYLGFRIYIYEKPDDTFDFTITAGKNNTLEQEKVYFNDVFSSANTDTKLFSTDPDSLSLGDAKTIISNWKTPTQGIYDVYYRVQVRNDSSVHLYDPLSFNWELKIDDDLKISETKDFLAGTKSVCAQDEICGRYTLLDKTNELYVDAVAEDNFEVVPGHTYELEFDLINGIDGSEGEIKNGSLQIYNALAPNESVDVVKNNISTRSFLQVFNYNLSGPSNEMHKENSGNFFGVFEEAYNFTELTKNKYVSGKLTLKPISGRSYLNFVVIDSDKKVIVQKKPALSLLFDVVSSKKLKVTLFPDRVLAPETTQNLKIAVSDDSNSFVKDAFVSVRLKKPTDNKYRILDDCGGVNELKTDPLGITECELKAQDLPAGTYVQVLVEKEGYEGYSQKDFTPDLQVSNKIFEFDKEFLSTNLIYPIQPEGYDDLTITNNTAKDITIDHLELIVNNYSQDALGYLNLLEMQNYISQIYNGKIILGRQMNYDEQSVLSGEAKSYLKNFFKAALNEQTAKEIEKDTKAGGFVKIFFKTEAKPLERIIPFSVNIVSDGYPTNSSDCLIIGFPSDITSFASDGSKPINIPVIVQNSCIIQTQNNSTVTVLPVTLDSAFIVINHEKGALGLGSYSFSLNTGEYTDLKFSVPKAFATNWQSQESEQLANISFMPRGVMGKETLNIKLIGTIQTSQGMKKVESKELKFDVSVLNIEDCIKVLNDKGNEFDYLNLEPKEFSIDTTSINPLQQAQKFDITIKNICEGIPLDIRICRDNTNNIPKSCGEDLLQKGFVGFSFVGLGEKQQYFEKKAITGDNTKVEISRPEISGAYALEIYSKQPKDMSYKRIKFLPVNVQTSFSNSLFMLNPFLETHTTSANHGILESDVMRVYNLNVPGPLKITDRNTFIRILKLESSSDIKIGSAADAASELDMASGRLTETIIGSASGAVSTVLISVLIAVTLSATATGWVIGGAVVAAVLAVVMLVLSSISNISDYQTREYVLIKDKDEPYFDHNNSNPNIDLEDLTYASLFKVTGQDHYEFNIVREDADGSVGMTSTTWTDRLNFEVGCSSSDYELDKENILYLSKGDPKTNFDDCWWASEPTISGNKVTFHPACGGSSYVDVELETYVVVPCKLKSELWGRANQGGIIGGYPNTGIFNLQFTDINFAKFYDDKTKCDSEWCFKTFPLNISNVILGSTQSNLRVAYHNLKPQEITINQSGFECTDVLGNVIGFTGEKAKPKISFDWSYDDINNEFCESDVNGDVKQYCDSTQFSISLLKHLQSAQEKLNTLGSPTCPYMNPFFNIKPEVSTQKEFFNDVLITKNADQTKLYLQATKIYDTELNAQAPNNKTYLVVGNASPKEMKAEIISTEIMLNGILKKRWKQLFTYELLTLPNPADLDPGKQTIYNQSVNLLFYGCDSNAQNCKNTEIVPTSIVVTATNWKGGCVVENPSTKILTDGRMLLFKFFKGVDENKLFEIQDILHYKAYLTDDGFSQDFLNDLYNYSQKNTFLNELSNLIDDFNISEKSPIGQFKIINDLQEPKTMGPGLYEVHVNLVFPKDSVEIKDANIEIVLNKIKHATNDNVFYYLPIDGRVGIDNSNIERQGYGVDFSGDNITIDTDILGEQLITNLGSNSTPKSHLEINKSVGFSKMNGLNRGTIFEAKRTESGPVNNISLSFVPKLQYWTLNYNMKNINKDQESGIYYSLIYNNNFQLQENSILPWFAKDQNKTDFTGQKLFDTYQKVSIRDDVDNTVSKIVYDATSVTDIADYNIYARVFGIEGASLYVKITKLQNLMKKKIIVGVPEKLNIETIAQVIEAISSGKLCISKSANSLYTRVFVKENK
ncbi:MAG: hypothetical protein COT14_00730 [Candidatus Diapherotrites archaeon CG08_land_8_20_14_0_20_30_16]|nr:MAG: hypothetical protein COT14_00730 [Candidatus Diapherotrites archaeon CG08_land_8_20_14_0_20_30_16]